MLLERERRDESTTVRYQKRDSLTMDDVSSYSRIMEVKIKFNYQTWTDLLG